MPTETPYITADHSSHSPTPLLTNTQNCKHWVSASMFSSLEMTILLSCKPIQKMAFYILSAMLFHRHFKLHMSKSQSGICSPTSNLPFSSSRANFFKSQGTSIYQSLTMNILITSDFSLFHFSHTFNHQDSKCYPFHYITSLIKCLTKLWVDSEEPI